MNLIRQACAIFFTLTFVMCSAQTETPEETRFYEHVEPILIDSCYDCHGDGADKGDFSMDSYESIQAHFEDIPVWYEIWKNVRHNLMPPANKPPLSDKAKAEVLSFIEDAVFKIDRKNPDPGRVTIRRLNRNEYQNTIADLLNVRFRAHDHFPPDDTGYGFDTIGDVLNISPLLMEKYLAAAKKIAAEAVPIAGPQIVEWSIDTKNFKSAEDENHTIKNLPLESKRRLEATRGIDDGGEYEIKVYYRIGGSREATEETATLNFGIDNQPLFSTKMAWNNSNQLVAKSKLTLKKGEHKFHFEMEPDQPREENESKLFVEIERIAYRGPLDGSKKDYPWQFRQIFSEGPPPLENDRDPYREKILRRLATQLYRRPPSDTMVDRLVALAREKDSQPDTGFEESIRYSLTAILTSPHFLLRAEIQPEPNNSDQILLLDEYALASRLSYLLWLSAPDQELMDLAAEKQLRKQLRLQIDRMLRDPKAERFITSFVGQWLQASNVETMFIDATRALNRRHSEAKKLFTGRLRQAMRIETESLFRYVLFKKLPATELLTADYAYLNQDLARWYNIEGVKGSDLRIVQLEGKDIERRGGILKQATFQIVTSNPNRTSPVKRGLFVLENLLAIPPPPAAPDVPALEETIENSHERLSLREALAKHSEDKSCAACHARMDPIGLALENYNFGGVWIDEYNNKPIDTAGELVTGETFNNAHELSIILATKKRREFHTAVTEKLFTFAIGRGVEFYDAPTIDSIVDNLEENDGRLIDILFGVIESPAFQKRRGDGSKLNKPKSK